MRPIDDIETPERYRDAAKRFRLLAANAADRYVAQILIDVAQAYEQLADQLERLKRLGID